MPHANDQVHIQGPHRDFASATGSLSPLSVRPGISPVPALPETALALQLPALPLLPPGLQAPAFREVRLEALPVRCTVCLVALVALPDHPVDGWLANSARQVSARHFAATTDEIQCGCNQIFAQIERRGAWRLPTHESHRCRFSSDRPGSRRRRSGPPFSSSTVPRWA